MLCEDRVFEFRVPGAGSEMETRVGSRVYLDVHVNMHTCAGRNPKPSAKKPYAYRNIE